MDNGPSIGAADHNTKEGNAYNKTAKTNKIIFYSAFTTHHLDLSKPHTISLEMISWQINMDAGRLEVD